MRHTIAIWLTGAALVLVGCGQGAANAPTTGPTAPSVPSVEPTNAPATIAPIPTVPASPTAYPVTETAPASATATAAVPTFGPTAPSPAAPSGRVTDTPAAAASPAPSQSPIVSVVLRSLQALPNIGSKTLSVQSVEAKEWSDSSLGCPDPAAIYLAVITPGYKIVLNDGATTYDVHTDNDGRTMVWCQAGKPVNVPRAP